MTEPHRDHILAVVEGAESGPTLVITGGVHGNEPAGLAAAVQVLEELRARRAPLHGRVYAVAGNISALAERRRYLRRDLNRRWEPAAIDQLEVSALSTLSAEDLEQRELMDLFLGLEHTANGPMVFLDLHTTSGASPPFICIADTLRNRRLARALPLPIILGLEEVIDASMLGFLVDRGHVGVAIEGGQHDDPTSVDRHASAVWTMLVAAGLLDAREVPDLAEHQANIAGPGAGLPPVVEIRHREETVDGDGFVMEPGWKSFQPVEAGTVVAHNAAGPIRAPVSGLMLMPRYQPLGEDGFFIIAEVRPFWLSVSAFMRRARLDALVPLLPGVEQDRLDRNRFVVGRRWMPPEAINVMHLLGFRRHVAQGGRLVFSRRREE